MCLPLFLFVPVHLQVKSANASKTIPIDTNTIAFFLIYFTVDIVVADYELYYKNNIYIYIYILRNKFKN